MKSALAMPFAPMEAKIARDLPAGSEWEYEPKWDGFRCIAFRDGDEVELQSKAGQPLTRYFPEMVQALLEVRAPKMVLDGELILAIDGQLSFDDLLQRIHPAASRVKMLSEKTPARLVVFDLLMDDAGLPLVAKPLEERRRALELFYAKYLDGNPNIQLSRTTRDIEVARDWMKGTRSLTGSWRSAWISRIFRENAP